MSKRVINLVVLHCAATKPTLSKSLTVEQVRDWHTKPKAEGGRGWSDIGYHYFIDYQGGISVGRPLKRQGAHVRGFNKNSIAICYAGGLDAEGAACDTRTDAQKAAIEALLKYLLKLEGHPAIKMADRVQVLGHRDLSPDQNKNGIIERHEWLKECPSFDALNEYKNLL